VRQKPPTQRSPDPPPGNRSGGFAAGETSPLRRSLCRAPVIKAERGPSSARCVRFQAAQTVSSG
jgi:hypothetical protein